MVKARQVHRHNKTGMYILISDYRVNDSHLVIVLNEKFYLHEKAIVTLTIDSAIKESYTLVANNYQAK